MLLYIILVGEGEKGNTMCKGNWNWVPTFVPFFFSFLIFKCKIVLREKEKEKGTKEVVVLECCS